MLIERVIGINSRSRALFIAETARDKKAENTIILDIGRVSDIADFFIISSGNSTRQVRAVADYIIEKLKQSGHKIWHIEGYQDACWILLDCGDVVVHLFHSRTREFYDLEKLWADAPQVQFKNDD